MELQEILSELEYLDDGTFPRQALEQAIARREETTPHLLASLEQDIGAIATIIEDERIYMAHLYAMYLLAQFREPRAYPLPLFQAPKPSSDARTFARAEAAKSGRSAAVLPQKGRPVS